MKRLFLSLILIGLVGSAVFGLTTAFFSDKEASTNNRLEAGKIDLLIDNTSYLNGVLNQDTTWESDNLPGHLFFNFNDIKPSDRGEDTISIKVEDNNAWACAEIKLTKNDDNTCTEPELEDDPTCSEPDNDLKDGELAQNLNMVFWADDGDNVLEENEATGSGILAQGTAQQVLDGTKITLADSTKNIFGQPPGTPLAGGQTYYIGKAWCFGTLTLAPLAQDNVGIGSSFSPANTTGGISCDGSDLDNATQTDVVMADLSFSAFQSRNNTSFTCSGEPTPSPSPTPTATPQACNKADVMLVLDRSGSIDSTELAQLKTAAKDFVDALGLSTIGIHAGKSSFATTASLNHHLTDDAVSLKASINAITSGGFTNLKAGIDLAKTELNNPGDGHDRPDGTSPDKMIIITDGHPNWPLLATAPVVAAASATVAKAAGIEIFVVGVGSDVDATYLQTQIASPGPGHYYSVSNYNNLKTTLQNINLCD